MVSGKKRPGYVPPSTTITIGPSGTSFSTKPRSTQLWSAVRDSIGTNERSSQYTGGHRGLNGANLESQAQHDKPRQTGQSSNRSKPQNRKAQNNGLEEYSTARPNGGSQYQKRGQYVDIEEEQQQEEQPSHFQTPDYNRLFDAADSYGIERGHGKERSDADQSRRVIGPAVSEQEGNSQRNKGFDVDNLDLGKDVDPVKRDRKRRSRRSGADQIGNGLDADAITPDAKEGDSGNESGSSQNGRRKAEFVIDENDESIDQDESIRSSDDETDLEGGNEVESKGKKRCGLRSILRKCAPKFANKLLDAIENAKKDCVLQFDDICKQHKEKNGKPIFTSYSCENGEQKHRFGSAMKGLRNLLGGFYTRACTEMENLANSAEDWLDEIKPQEDESWSQLDSDHGIRCVPHYDNQVQDHSIYVCCNCFNEEVDKDAHVNVKYLDSQYGSCNPVVVMRSFENRPYFCERILASMSEKRREIFLRRIGKKHHMKSGVHCRADLPPMKEESDGPDETASELKAQSDEDS